MLGRNGYQQNNKFCIVSNQEMKIIRVARVFSEILKVQKQISQSNLTQNAVDSWFNRRTSDSTSSLRIHVPWRIYGTKGRYAYMNGPFL